MGRRMTPRGRAHEFPVLACVTWVDVTAPGASVVSVAGLAGVAGGAGVAGVAGVARGTLGGG